MSTDKLIVRHYFGEPCKLVDGIARFAATSLLESLANKNFASLVLPGGKTPRLFLPQLGKLNLPWERVQLTLSDERWVSTTNPDSNEKQLREIFLKGMSSAPRFIPLKTDHAHPKEALSIIDAHLAGMSLPFDLAILGIGEDGHIASLFPGMTLDSHEAHLCQIATPPAAPSLRISLSFRTLVEARQVAFVILGKSKRQLLDRLLSSMDETIPFVKLLQHRSVTVFESDA